MPIEVDEARRLDEIVEAAMNVAREQGAGAVTVRAVAKQLGRSTSVVTNYVPNRSALLLAIIRRAQQVWTVEADQVVEGLTGLERLRAYCAWMTTTSADDTVIRKLLMEVLSDAGDTPPDVEREIHLMAAEQRRELADLAAEAGLPSPALAADTLHLLLRGFWLASLEEPAVWSAAVGARLTRAAIDSLMAGPDARGGAGPKKGR
jgi:AcrR family transcriptional regulator